MRCVAVLILFVAATAAAKEDRDAAKENYAEGMKLYNLGDYRNAREKFRAAYLAFPDPIFLFDIGQSSRMLGDGPEAVRSYRAFLREKPDAPNRAAVEGFITDAEREIARHAAEKPPTETVGPGEPTKTPPPTTAVEKPTPTTETHPTEAKPTRWWVWLAIGGAVVVAAVVAAVLAVELAPKDVQIPSTTAGNVGVVFP